MKSNIKLSMAAAIALLTACSSGNKTAATADENTQLDTVGLQGDWRLAAYSIDSVSTQFDASAGYKLTFDEPNNVFAIATDCNTINGEFGISNDTIRFTNTLVTEMACENMAVEESMLRLINDSTAYAMCEGDTLALNAPAVGTATFVKQK